MKKRKISITSENGVKIAIESECTSEQVKTSQDKRQEYVEFCKAILCEWDNIPRTCGATIKCAFESKIMTMPVGWICGDLLKKLLQCYVEHNS